MKKISLASLLVACALSAPAAVTYVDLGDLVIPNTPDGIYINILTHVHQENFPADFNTAPWINIYLGGIGISNSDLLRPWASNSPYDPDAGDYFLNMDPGTIIDSSGVFVAGESNSESHMSLVADGTHFQSGVQGYLAFAYEGTLGGGTSYGWLSFTPNGGGEGVSFDFAYTDTPGETVEVAAVPEPSSCAALGGALALGAAVLLRRKRIG
jgi:hypothetical protein